MKTIILILANFKVENVSETVNSFRAETASFVGQRFVLNNETELTVLTLSTQLSANDKGVIAESAAAKNLGVVFVETEYNLLNGSTVMGL